ncbi:MAG: hypothetical protein WCT42_03810 [Candidatus Paceibacterota bacterium]
MKDKELVTVLVLIIVLLLIGGAYLLGRKSENQKMSPIPNNYESSGHQGEYQNIDGSKLNNNENVQQNKINWLKSPTFELYYQDDLNIIEYYVNATGKNVDKTEGVPFFGSTLKPNNDFSITWGGYWKSDKAVCTQSDFGVFQYGVSKIACVKGYRASAGHFSARAIVTQDELKMFGDFVLKNQ